MKIFLDDLRPAPRGWTWCRTPAEVIDLLETNRGQVTDLSLDNDLGKIEGVMVPEGLTVVKWLQEQMVLYGYPPVKVRLHSDNPEALRHMRLMCESIFYRTGYKIFKPYVKTGDEHFIVGFAQQT